MTSVEKPTRVFTAGSSAPFGRGCVSSQSLYPGLSGRRSGCWKLEVCPCVHVCQQQELGGCVLSSTSALTVYGAQWGVWWAETLEALGLLGCFQTPLGVGP